MSKQPHIPEEQRSHAGGAGSERRDRRSGAQGGQPGDADLNLKSQGRYGNIAQNIIHQGRQQDR